MLERIFVVVVVVVVVVDPLASQKLELETKETGKVRGGRRMLLHSVSQEQMHALRKVGIITA